jgi:polysaccharide export outer membrane protein
MVNGVGLSILLLSQTPTYMNRFSSLLAVLAMSMLFASCGINSEFMFQTPDDYVFDVPVIDSSSIDYRIQPNDVISFEIFTNEGALMLEVSTSSAETQTAVRTANIEYVVNSQGFVEFPIIGMQKISGYNIAEAQDFIEDMYTPQFNRPYVQLKVMNRRAIIFTSPAGSGSVLQLGKESISVVEALAKSGGIGQYGKADDIKLIRKIEGGERQVFHIDLSTIEGVRYADMSVEAGDIIYVQPRKRISQQASAEARSWTFLISGLILLLTLPQRVF